MKIPKRLPNFRTQTPKGDGNDLAWLVFVSYRAYFRTQTPKGDGNATSSGMIATADGLFQNTNPERGRKLKVISGSMICKSHFRTQTPKGDGNMSQKECSDTQNHEFQNTNPERGRKRNSRSLVPSGKISNFRTQTPKGDRNIVYLTSVTLLSVIISEHKPRKGTETLSENSNFLLREIRFQNTNPERGRKLGAPDSGLAYVH